jgi:tetratricopeptide (TPR) repeat protein
MKRSIHSIYSVPVLMSLLFVHSVMAEPGTSAQRVRLEVALAQYAEALEEPNHDDRLAVFAQAEIGFASVIESGAKNAPLYTNLGNAALQAEHIGQAVLAYHRALRLDPDAKAARQNLVYIRSLLPSWVPRPNSSSEMQPLFFYRHISPAIRSYLAAGCFVLAAASLAISVRRREGAWRGVALMGGVAWALIVATIVFDSVGESVELAVMTADESLARSADSRLAALAYPDPLPGGVEVEELEKRAEWTRVRLHNGRDVWVRGSNVTRVAE